MQENQNKSGSGINPSLFSLVIAPPSARPLPPPPSYFHLPLPSPSPRPSLLPIVAVPYTIRLCPLTHSHCLPALLAFSFFTSALDVCAPSCRRIFPPSPSLSLAPASLPLRFIALFCLPHLTLPVAHSSHAAIPADTHHTRTCRCCCRTAASISAVPASLSLVAPLSLHPSSSFRLARPRASLSCREQCGHLLPFASISAFVDRSCVAPHTSGQEESTTGGGGITQRTNQDSLHADPSPHRCSRSSAVPPVHLHRLIHISRDHLI